MIGRLNDPSTSNILDLDKFNHRQTVKFDFNPSGCCEYLNKKILVTDSANNCLKVFEFDRRFRLVRSIHRISECELIEPTAIKCDSQKQYVVLCLSRKILIIDIFLEKILAEIMLTLFMPGASSSSSCSLFSTSIRDVYFSKKFNSLFILYQSKVFEVKYSSQNEEEVLIKKIDDSSLNAAVETLDKKPEHIAGFEESIAIHIGQKIMIYSLKSGLFESEILVDNEIERIHSMFFCEDGSKLFVHLNENGLDKLVCFVQKDLFEWEKAIELILPVEIRGSWKMEYIHGKLVIVPWSRNLVIFS